MKIRIEKKNSDLYLVLFADENEKEVKGIYLSLVEVKKLKANLDQLLEYDMDKAGDSI